MNPPRGSSPRPVGETGCVSSTPGDVGVEVAAEGNSTARRTTSSSTRSRASTGAPPRSAFDIPISVVDTSGAKPVAIDANGVCPYAAAVLVTVSVGALSYAAAQPGIPQVRCAEHNP